MDSIGAAENGDADGAGSGLVWFCSIWRRSAPASGVDCAIAMPQVNIEKAATGTQRSLRRR